MPRLALMSYKDHIQDIQRQVHEPSCAVQIGKEDQMRDQYLQHYHGNTNKFCFLPPHVASINMEYAQSELSWHALQYLSLMFPSGSIKYTD